MYLPSTVYCFLNKSTIIPSDPARLLLCIYPEDSKSWLTEALGPDLVPSQRHLPAHQCSTRQPATGKWTRKMWYIITVEFPFSHKEGWSYVSAGKWVHLEISKLSGLSRSQKDKCLWSHSLVIWNFAWSRKVNMCMLKESSRESIWGQPGLTGGAGGGTGE